MCWTCWKQRLSATLRPLFYLAVFCLSSKTVELFNARPLFDTPFCLAYYLAFIKIFIPILTVLVQPAWYDEDASEDHCHYRDTPEKMAAERRRVQAELAILWGRIQAGVREPFFPL